MTAFDFEQPRMVWTGPLPAHLTRPEDPFTQDAVAEGPAAPRRWLPVVLVVGGSLAAGIAIGVFVTPLLHPAPQVSPPPAAAPAAAPVPLIPAVPLQARPP